MLSFSQRACAALAAGIWLAGVPAQASPKPESPAPRTLRDLVQSRRQRWLDRATTDKIRVLELEGDANHRDQTRANLRSQISGLESKTWTAQREKRGLEDTAGALDRRIAERRRAIADVELIEEQGISEALVRATGACVDAFVDLATSGVRAFIGGDAASSAGKTTKRIRVYGADDEDGPAEKGTVVPRSDDSEKSRGPRVVYAKPRSSSSGPSSETSERLRLTPRAFEAYKGETARLNDRVAEMRGELLAKGDEIRELEKLVETKTQERDGIQSGDHLRSSIATVQRRLDRYLSWAERIENIEAAANQGKLRLPVPPERYIKLGAAESKADAAKRPDPTAREAARWRALARKYQLFAGAVGMGNQVELADGTITWDMKGRGRHPLQDRISVDFRDDPEQTIVIATADGVSKSHRPEAFAQPLVRLYQQNPATTEDEVLQLVEKASREYHETVGEIPSDVQTPYGAAAFLGLKIVTNPATGERRLTGVGLGDTMVFVLRKGKLVFGSGYPRNHGDPSGISSGPIKSFNTLPGNQWRIPPPIDVPLETGDVVMGATDAVGGWAEEQRTWLPRGKEWATPADAEADDAMFDAFGQLATIRSVHSDTEDALSLGELVRLARGFQKKEPGVNGRVDVKHVKALGPDEPANMTVDDSSFWKLEIPPATPARVSHT